MQTDCWLDMRKLILSSLVALAAAASVAGANIGSATAASEDAPVAIAAPVSTPSAVAGVNEEDLPPVGECKVWYDGLPTHVQPARMDCEHATWIAQRWGGRVISNTQDGGVELAAYEGRNDFTGVPVSELPSRGFCRAWVDGLEVSAQPEESDCRVARTTAREQGGRVLYMPL